MRVDFIYLHREEWPVNVLCKVMKVCRSYYYQAIKVKQNQVDDNLETIKKCLKELFNQNKQIYGSRRLMKALRDEGGSVGLRQLLQCG